MAESDAKVSPAGGASSGPVKPPKPPNPVWRMMGLPNIRFKLPSRNWMIFLTVTGSWTAAVMYDRREKRRIQRKWAKVVEHIAQETVDTQQLVRKVTVYVAAPPADGIVPARDHFHEYVKPILVAAALDWDAVEGRREGDVRAGLAERIRKLRKTRGEPTTEPIEEETQDLYDAIRARAGVTEWDGPAGDIVIGRHSWKEYVRGLHEGWLGPIDTPAHLLPVPESLPEPAPLPATSTSPPIDSASPSAVAPTPGATLDDASPTAPEAPETAETPKAEEAEKAKEDEKKPKKKKKQPPPFISTADYENATLPPTCPRLLGPATAVPLPHLLGFFNFPIRMYRFLNRRYVADDAGRQTAAAVLGVFRPFDPPSANASVGDEDGASEWEQQRLLKHEESSWHKSVRERKDNDERERVWIDDMVLDARIAERMRKFELDAEAEDRAKNLADDAGDSWYSSLWPRTEKKKQLWEGLTDDE